MTTAVLKPRPAQRGGIGVDIRQLINPLPSQTRFLNEMYRKEYVLFGGAAGPGKSYVLRWGVLELLLHWASQGHRDVRVGLFCEDYPTLKDRQLTRMEREFPRWLGEIRETKTDGFCYFLRPEFGGGQIALRNLDDPSKYSSAEFACIAVDELTRNDRQTFDDLRFRKRWPGIIHRPFLGATNPGSVGHSWVKKLWIDRDFSGEDQRLDPETFVFIPARVQEMIDNRPDLVDSSYIETLRSLPEAMRRAMLEGDWNVFAGQVFAEWRPHLHVCDPFVIPTDWTRWRAVDYGYAAPFCALWLARSPDKKRLVAYRELYQAGLRASQQAQAIRLASGQERIWQTAADPSMWQKRQDAEGDTLATEYANNGVPLTKANNNRLAGWAAVHEALAWREIDGLLVQPPRLQVFATCHNLVRTLPALPYDKIKVEDADTLANDHCVIAETAVMTHRGEIPISEVRPGTEVLTRDGWRLVRRAWQTRPDASVLAVSLSNGRRLVGSGEHRVWSNGEWKRLDTLRYGDILQAWSRSSVLPSKSLKAFDITSAGRTSSARVLDGSTASCGRRITGLCRKALMSIIATMTAATTRSRTWCLRRAQNISGITGVIQAKLLGRPLVATSSAPTNGIAPRLALSGIGNTLSAVSSAPFVSSGPARNAVSSIPAVMSTLVVPGSVQTPASPVIGGEQKLIKRSAPAPVADNRSEPIASNQQPPAAVYVLGVYDAGHAPVYNLTVEGCPEFYAEGVLVHNCADSLRYGLMAEGGYEFKPEVGMRRYAW